MVCGASLAIYNYTDKTTQTQTVAAAQPLQWNVKPGTLPLDIQFDLDKRLNNETPKTKDTVIIRDSVRIIEKIQWKTRYKTIAERTAAREVGEHLAAVNPDSLSSEPTINSTLEREEKSSEIVDTSKVSSIQLTVNGKIVYSKNENHSTGEGQ